MTHLTSFDIRQYAYSLLALIILVSGLFIAPSNVLAGARIFDQTDSCTTINCKSAVLNGTYNFDSTDVPDPFTVQVFAFDRLCLRLEITTTDIPSDLEMVLVSPNGTVWRDDNSGSGLHPLIKADTTRAGTGWYTLHISQTDGLDPTTNFILRHGRYALPNTNCSSPTPPL